MKRHRIVSGFREGIVVPEGLIAHGRGEMFDYLLGEVSIPPALIAEQASAAFILDAENPVISVNGNAAALGADSIVELSTVTGAKIEVNLFHWSEERVSAIRSLLEKFGAKGVLAEKPDAFLEGINQDRGRCHAEGIFSADVVLIPLEDGDRAQALAEMGKTVISIDLNPLSRTSLSANVSIIDELTRAIPNITKFARELKDNKRMISETIKAYDNSDVLRAVFKHISDRLDKLSKK